MDKFISPYPLPTAREREILVILIEECAEVQKRATKALRFGLGETQPGHSYDNSGRLSLEVGDVLTTIDLARNEGILQATAIAEGKAHKLEQLAKYMQTEPSNSKKEDS